ncbi:Obg family GTPase CgtA, partial [Ostertagia ostertagi]
NKLKRQNCFYSNVFSSDGLQFLDVPVGVEAVDEDRNVLLARCTKPFHTYLIARGGCGGDARNNFKGERGEQLNVSLHLKLRPNVGLVGFPNAGKSTLMKAFVPRKSIKIAPYPFTTTKPQVAFWTVDKGKKEVESDFTLSFADLPGLIEGASQNRGKGYKFLKHLEYSDILLLIVDCMGFQLSNKLNEPFRSPIEVVALLNRELENYDRKLVQKPAVLLFNKIDIAPEGVPEKLVEKMSGMDWPRHVPEQYRPAIPLIFDYVLPVSAKLGEVEEVKKALIRVYKGLRPSMIPESTFDDLDKTLL